MHTLKQTIPPLPHYLKLWFKTIISIFNDESCNMDLRLGSKTKPSGPSRRSVLTCHPGHLCSHHPKKLVWFEVTFCFPVDPLLCSRVNSTCSFLEPTTTVV